MIFTHLLFPASVAGVPPVPFFPRPLLGGGTGGFHFYMSNETPRQANITTDKANIQNMAPRNGVEYGVTPSLVSYQIELIIRISTKMVARRPPPIGTSSAVRTASIISAALLVLFGLLREVLGQLLQHLPCRDQLDSLILILREHLFGHE